MERINWLQRRQESYATMYNFLLLPWGTKARGRYIYGEESLECVLGVTRLMISEEEKGTELIVEVIWTHVKYFARVIYACSMMLERELT